VRFVSLREAAAAVTDPAIADALVPPSPPGAAKQSGSSDGARGNRANAMALRRAVLDSEAAALGENARLFWDVVRDDHSVGAVMVEAGTGASLIGQAIGQSLGLPVFAVAESPAVTSSQIPSMAVHSPTPGSFLAGSVANRLTHFAARQVDWLAVGEQVNRFRRFLGIEDISDVSMDGALVHLHLFSEHMVATPRDWPRDSYVVGLPDFAPVLAAMADANPSSTALTSFLEVQDPPVYINFGAMPMPDGTIDQIVEALGSLEMRAILAGDWVESDVSEGEVTPGIFVVHGQRYDLVESCSLAVHAGDPTMVALSSSAGIPQVVFPMTPVQIFWARALATIGVTPTGEPRYLSEFNADSLVRGISCVDDDQRRAVATNLGEQVKTESSLSYGVAQLELLFAKKRYCGRRMREGGWQPDDEAPVCTTCGVEWTFTVRRHHCRVCGYIFCSDCLALDRVPNYGKEVMVCRQCFEARGYLEEKGSVWPGFREQETNAPDTTAAAEANNGLEA
jgi:vancomycin aglycone glucosyltransferase